MAESTILSSSSNKVVSASGSKVETKQVALVERDELHSMVQHVKRHRAECQEALDTLTCLEQNLKRVLACPILLVRDPLLGLAARAVPADDLVNLQWANTKTAAAADLALASKTTLEIRRENSQFVIAPWNKRALLGWSAPLTHLTTLGLESMGGQNVPILLGILGKQVQMIAIQDHARAMLVSLGTRLPRLRHLVFQLSDELKHVNWSQIRDMWSRFATASGPELVRLTILARNDMLVNIQLFDAVWYFAILLRKLAALEIIFQDQGILMAWGPALQAIESLRVFRSDVCLLNRDMVGFRSDQFGLLPPITTAHRNLEVLSLPNLCYDKHRARVLEALMNLPKLGYLDIDLHLVDYALPANNQNANREFDQFVDKMSQLWFVRFYPSPSGPYYPDEPRIRNCHQAYAGQEAERKVWNRRGAWTEARNQALHTAGLPTDFDQAMTGIPMDPDPDHDWPSSIQYLYKDHQVAHVLYELALSKMAPSPAIKTRRSLTLTLR